MCSLRLFVVLGPHRVYRGRERRLKNSPALNISPTNIPERQGKSPKNMFSNPHEFKFLVT